jgi:hypothetical protein
LFKHLLNSPPIGNWNPPFARNNNYSSRNNRGDVDVEIARREKIERKIKWRVWQKEAGLTIAETPMN